MTLEKAIRELGIRRDHFVVINDTAGAVSSQIGINAIKRELDHRKIDNSPCAGLLPGETKE